MNKLVAHIFFFISIAGWSQTDYRFNNFTINDGLSQSSVTCIIQDDLNSLWVGTQDGINRYDGKSFEIFNSDNTEGIRSEYVNCAIKDNKGNLWFGTKGGLTTYQLASETFKTYTLPNNKAFKVESAVIDNNGVFWIASTDKGLFSFDTISKRFTSHQGTVDGRKLTTVYLLGDNELMVASEDEELTIFNTSLKHVRKIPLQGRVAGARINKIIRGEGNRIITATSAGVFTINYSTGKSTETFDVLKGKKLNVSDIRLLNHKEWLIATRNDGLYTVTEDDKLKHSISDVFQKGTLLFDELNNIFIDNAGTVWLGSHRGLSAYDPSYSGILGVGVSGNPKRGLPTASVWSFAEDQTRRYLFIGSDRAISRLDRNTGIYDQFYRQESNDASSGEKTVLSISVINLNRALVGCADGFFELKSDGKGYKYNRIKLSASGKHQRVYKVVHHKNEDYFLATKDGVVLYNLKKGVISTFEHDPQNKKNTISNGVCRLVYKDRSGGVWFTTSTGGLNKLIERGEELKIVPYKFNSHLSRVSNEAIASIHIDSKDVFWMGTMGSGLLRWEEKSKKLEVYTKKEGIANNVIYGVLEDKNGGLWMSTNKGVSYLNKKSKKVINYTEQDGLYGNEFNLGAYMVTSTGELYFGGIFGCNYFSPEKINTHNNNIDVIFTRFKIDNEWLKPNSPGSPLKQPLFRTKQIDLSYKQRSFTIKFQPSQLSNSDRINYKYFLEGSDEGEILLGNNNEIHFNSLSPGTYTLNVYARNADGPWCTTPASIIIVIATPFWLTWWFLGLLVLVGALFVRVLFRSRVESARREQVKLEMKIRARTKEINKQKLEIEEQKTKVEEERNKVIKQQELLQVEKDKSEKLLKNVIPESTAEELKKRGKARARAYKTVSVLFTDFVGFTRISERMTATELVRKLDVYFTKFDKIIVKNNLEKIKTIGDAYMCAGGVPVRNNTNPIDTCLAAIQIQHYMNQRKNEALANNDEFWELRLGINTGEVTAGVIGSERLAYDVWGATVNQAQRMEMLGEPGKVTVTGATYNHIEPYFQCTFKGKAQSKSRGLIDMYVVEQIKPELSVGGKGIEPNTRFNQIVNLHHYSSINYYKAERHIMQLLEKHLSKDLLYHSIDHTKDVVTAVERIALLENVTDEGLFLLKSAATYHDAGFIEQYDKNEPIGVRLADEILPKYGYTKKHIEIIKSLINVTAIPHKPQTHLEEIICDADLDYLGRDDFPQISDKLCQELKEHGKIANNKEWDLIQVSFLSSHVYFTKTAKKTRKKKKEANLQEVKDRLAADNYTE